MCVSQSITKKHLLMEYVQKAVQKAVQKVGKKDKIFLRQWFSVCEKERLRNRSKPVALIIKRLNLHRQLNKKRKTLYQMLGRDSLNHVPLLFKPNLLLAFKLYKLYRTQFLPLSSKSLPLTGKLFTDVWLVHIL